MDQLTVRGIDESLHEWLKLEAKRHNQSVNRYVLTLLQEASGRNKTEKRTAVTHHELDHLAGSWSETEMQEFLKRVVQERAIEEDLWQ